MIPPLNEGDEIASYIVGISFEDRVFLAQCYAQSLPTAALSRRRLTGRKNTIFKKPWGDCIKNGSIDLP